MDTHFIAILKRKFVAKYGSRVESSIVDNFLISKAPEFFKAREIVRSGNADWLTLKKYSTFCRYDENQNIFESVLKKFDPALNFPHSEHTQFIGDGFGDGSLNSYRIVQIKDKIYFEKIYLKESLDYKNSLWFYMTLQQRLADAGLKTPILNNIIEGNVLSVVYSEYIKNTSPVSRNKALRLYKKQFDIFYEIKSYPDDKHRCDLTDHVLYQDGMKKAAEFVSHSCNDDGESLSNMEKSINYKIKMFNHGDWYRKNINKKGIVFDWDRCGFYPAGFDLAYCFSKSIKVNSLSDLNRAIKKFSPRILRAECLHAIWFFCFIFYARRVGVQVSDNFLSELYYEVKKIII